MYHPFLFKSRNAVNNSDFFFGIKIFRTRNYLIYVLRIYLLNSVELIVVTKACKDVIK